MDMKPWQHGLELSFLKDMEKKWERYNSFTLSPFAKFKKNNIAEAWHKDTLMVFDDGAFVAEIAKAKSNIVMHGSTVIGIKAPGDITITKINNYSSELVAEELAAGIYLNSNCWLYTWAEDERADAFANNLGFDYVGGKITTFGEVYSIYYRQSARTKLFVETVHPEINPLEKVNIIKLSDAVDQTLIEGVTKKLINADLLKLFENHYSNYNKGKSWRALSLRGYTPDPNFIAKPIEMSKEWKEKHKDNLFYLQDTLVATAFPEVWDLFEFADGDVHRVRFMSLEPNEGELSRHTDQVDPDSYNTLGGLIRLHFPLITNDKVKFTSWNYDGVRHDVHMKVGECWMLDTRKPHMVVNHGDTVRVHLVVDIVNTPKLAEMILASAVRDNRVDVY